MNSNMDTNSTISKEVHEPANNAPATQAHLVSVPEIQPQAPFGPAVLGGNMRLLDSVKVSLNVMVGQIQTSVGELMDLKESSVLKIDRAVDYPIDVMLNGSVVARGHLVAVDDNFGVRITEIAPGGQP